MPDMTTEVLIKLLTKAETGGVEAVKSELNKLIESTKESSAESAKHSIESEKLIGMMKNFGVAMRSLPQAFQGNAVAASQFFQSVKNLTGGLKGLGPVMAVVGTALAGFKIGAMIEQFRQGGAAADDLKSKFNDLKLSFMAAMTKGMELDNLKKPIEAIGEMALKSRDRMGALNEARLDKLRDEISSAEKATRDLLDAIDALARNKGLQSEAAGELKLAQIEAMPEGPERDRAMAEERLRQKREQAAIRLEREESRRAALQKNLQEASERRASEEANLSWEKKSQLEARDRAMSLVNNRNATTPEERDQETLEITKANNALYAANQRVRDAEERAKEARAAEEKAKADAKEIESIKVKIEAEKTKQQAEEIRAGTETGKIDARVAGEKAKQTAEERKAAAQADLDAARKAAEEMRGALPGARAAAAKEKGDIPTAQAALDRFDATGIYVDEEGREKKISRKGSAGRDVRKMLEDRVMKEQQEAVDAENVYTDLETAVDQSSQQIRDAGDQIKAGADELAGATGELAGEANQAFEQILASLRQLTQNYTAAARMAQQAAAAAAAAMNAADIAQSQVENQPY